jgi:hypothetical protein
MLFAGKCYRLASRELALLCHYMNPLTTFKTLDLMDIFVTLLYHAAPALLPVVLPTTEIRSRYSLNSKSSEVC